MMLTRTIAAGAILCVTPHLAELRQSTTTQHDAYLSWSEERAVTVVRSMRADGRVGGWLDTRILNTERSYNYKLRATWMTPDAIRASARLAQLAAYLSDDETRALVAEAESAGDTVVMVEIDPREGSGVIPLDWIALLQPKHPGGQVERPVRGQSNRNLRRVKALSSGLPREYDYDVFWVVFPLLHADGSATLPEGTAEAELIVRIYDKEGRVQWRIPASISRRSLALATERQGTG